MRSSSQNQNVLRNSADAGQALPNHPQRPLGQFTRSLRRNSLPEQHLNEAAPKHNTPAPNHRRTHTNPHTHHIACLLTPVSYTHPYTHAHTRMQAWQASTQTHKRTGGLAARENTYFSLAWLSEGTVEPLPLEYMFVPVVPAAAVSGGMADEGLQAHLPPQLGRCSVRSESKRPPRAHTRTEQQQQQRPL